MSDGKRIIFVGVSIDMCEGCRSIELVSKESYCIKCSGRSNYGDRLDEGCRDWVDDELVDDDDYGKLRIKRKGEDRFYYE